jgi:TolB-like protein
VEFFADIGVWISENEALLSGIAAMIVVAGVVFTPFGVGLRRFLGSRSNGATGSAAAPPDQETGSPGQTTNKPSIAVLAFANMSNDSEQEFLADGMTEDIITGLAASRHLFVVSRNSTFAYKGQSPDIRDVGRELGVRYVLEGSVRRVGDKLRVTVQLIETASGSHLWAEKYDRPVAEMFEVQDEVVARIGGSLVAQLSSAEWERSQREPPANLGAWELTQRGLGGTMVHTPCIESGQRSLTARRTRSCWPTWAPPTSTRAATSARSATSSDRWIAIPTNRTR